MDKDKIITEALNEYYNTSVGPIAHGYSGEVSLSNLGDPKVIDTLNGIISKNANLVFLNPQAAVERIRNRMRILGIDFGSLEISSEEGMARLPITQWNRYGFTDMDGIVKADDGISHKVPGGLSIVFRWVKVKGMWTVDAEIERNASVVSEDLNRQKFRNNLAKERRKVKKANPQDSMMPSINSFLSHIKQEKLRLAAAAAAEKLQ